MFSEINKVTKGKKRINQFLWFNFSIMIEVLENFQQAIMMMT